MRLELEVLDGRRQGQKIVIDPASTLADNLPYVLETDTLVVTVHMDRPVYSVSLVLENTVLELSPIEKGDDSSSDTFRAFPARRSEGGFEALFLNYCGIAVFYLTVDDADGSALIELGQIEVLARKASVDQVEAMVNYIVGAGQTQLLSAQGATRRGGSPSGDSGRTPQRLIEHLEDNIGLIEDLLPYVINAPLSSLSSKLEILSGSPGLDLHEQNIAWLAENMSVFTPSDDPDFALLEYEGEHFGVSEVQTSVMYENTDIYENRVLHGYLENLLKFTQDLIRGYSDAVMLNSSNSHEGYRSFFSAVSNLVKLTNATQIQRVHQIQNRIRRARKSLRERVKVKIPDPSLPLFTAKVRSNRNYSTLFRSIHTWYQSSSINWDAQRFLLSINNIPKLFEVYTVLKAVEWCQGVGSKGGNLDGAIWSGTIADRKVRLLYEPQYWMPAHVDQEGSIVNTQNRSAEGAKSDRLNRVRRGEYQHRSPDIVLEVATANGHLNLIVLDAKYTNQKLAFERYLPECIIKYVHGLGSFSEPRLVLAMFILYPDLEGAYLDFHTKPFDAYGDCPQLPLLGAQGISLDKDGGCIKFSDLLAQALVMT